MAPIGKRGMHAMDTSSFNVEDFHQFLMTAGLQMAINVAIATLILIVGYLIAGAVSRAIRNIPDRSPRLDRTLANFFASLANTPSWPWSSLPC